MTLSLKNININDICEKAVKVADDVDIMLGGVEWLIKSREAAEIISRFDPTIQENLYIMVASTVGPLRVSEELLDKLDRYIIGPRCNRKSRKSKKQEGVRLISNLFTDITNDEAYNKVCHLFEKTVKLLATLVKTLGYALSSTIITATIATSAGPEMVAGLKMAHSSGKQSLKLATTIQKTVCVFLRKEVKKA